MVGRSDSEDLQNLRAAIRRNGKNPADLRTLGLALTRRCEYQRAAVCLNAAAVRSPSDPALLHDLAIALSSSGRPEQATCRLERALAIDPRRLESWELLGSMYLDLHKPSEALRCFHRAIQLAPREVRNYQNAALCGDLTGDVPFPADANPALARLGAGLALAETGRYPEAAAVLQEIVSREPHHLVALEGLARVCTGMHDLDAAQRCLEQALPAAGDDRDIVLGYLLHWMRRGDVERARCLYRDRGQALPLSFGLPPSTPRWNGQNVCGQTVFLFSGDIYFGDAIQFCRFARTAKQAGARVIVQGPRRIRPLLKTVPGVDLAIAPHDPAPPHDCGLGIFWLLFASNAPFEDLLGETPYMQAASYLRAEWRARFRSRPGLNIGIAWHGSAYQARNRYARRIMSLEQLRPLAAVPNVNLYSLQRGPGRGELTSGTFPAVDLAPDFINTAAAIAELDLVVTIDTSIAHLAGALGKRVFVMLPYDACFRWMMDREDTPWYRTMRLFRQSQPGEWTDVVARVAAEVAGLKTRSAAAG